MVRILKLTSGEEVIALVEKEENGTYFLKHTYRIAPAPQGLGMIPLAMGAKSDIVISIAATHVMFVCEAETELENKFNESLGIGIIKPQSAIKLVE